MFEELWYEISPGIYLIISGIATAFANKWANVFVFLLVAMSLLIMFLRLKYRLAPPPLPGEIVRKSQLYRRA